MSAAPRMHFLRACLFWFLLLAGANAADPLRVFIRAGAKTHGPGQHDHPRFLAEWTKLLTERGAVVEGALDWPTPEQWAKTDVVIVFAPDPWDTSPEQRAEIERFAARGGGFVVLHDGLCSKQHPDWVKKLLGGAWRYGQAKWFEGDISFYYVDNANPITAGASNFDLRDEMYYDLDLAPEAKVLASTWTPDARAQQNGRAFPHIYHTAPQLWTFENGGSRAFVDLLGHEAATFNLPQVRAVLLRGIAWAGKRATVDEFCAKEELASLRYPPGGPTAPADAGKKLTVHPDFTAKLVAAEPLINKPIAIDWDARGRMWVAETPEYPNGRRGLREDFAGAEWKDHGGLVPQAGLQVRPARDRISILIDSDGDGVADKKEIFYEGLELVTGFVFHRDGVIACAAPDVWWIRDTDGDGKADKVEKLYTGLGTSDTHAVINNLRWGMDGWIYATHGYSASDHVTNGTGEKDFGRIGSGVVRFRPDGSAFEQYSSKGGNTWGLAITGNNDVFWTQPTSGDLLMQTLLPESLLARGRAEGATSFHVVTKSPKSFPEMTWPQQAYRQIDYVGSFTAAAGCAIYDGGTWPAKYNGSYFTTEPTINIVHHELLEPSGASFTAHKEAGREQTEFIRTSDLWFRPIEVRIGPDGALYVLDFYNQAVIHNDTRGPTHNKVNAAVRPDRDHYFGRIWRIDHKEAQPLTGPDLSHAKQEDLRAALHSANRPTRFTAQRLLAEQGVSTAGIKPTEEQLVAAVREGNERERLAALRALAERDPARETLQALLPLSPQWPDRFAQSAFLAIANRQPALTLEIALTMSEARAALPVLVRVARTLAAQPYQAVQLVIAIAAQGKIDPMLSAALLEALAADARRGNRPQWDAGLKAALKTLLQRSEGEAMAVLPLALAWDMDGSLREEARALLPRLQAQLASSASEGLVSTLVAARELDASIMLSLQKLLVASNTPPALQARLVEALGDTDDREVASSLLAGYAQYAPALQQAVFAQALKRPAWTRVLIDQLAAQAIPLQAFGIVAVDKLRHHPDADMARLAAQTIDKLRGPMTQKKDELIASLLPGVQEGGNVARGKTLFAACAACHRFNGEGAALAPDLTGMGAHPRAELLTHIVDPNREVDPSFAAYDFQMKSGEVFQGIIASENARTVRLRDAAGEHELVKGDIASRREVGRSLMPEGFEALGAEGLRDLLAYLQSSDSRFRVLDLRTAFTADSRRGLFQNEENVKESLAFKKFGSVRVGEVPFAIVDPASSAAGRNLIVLRGDSGVARSYPQKVEFDGGRVEADALHILGGVGGWAFPCCGDEKSEGLPVARIIVEHVGGETEEIVLKNGVELADYVRPHDVPGSRLAEGLVNGGQVRVIRKELTKRGAIEKITLESFDTRVAPVFVAITAESGVAAHSRE